MKSRIFLSLFFSLIVITSKAQTKVQTKQQVKDDIESLRKILNENSSYVYLNGYDFNKDFENYQQNLKDAIPLEDFASFLTKSMGRIGDRHSSVRGGEVRDSLYLPFIFAPESNKIIALNRNAAKELEILNPKFPYLKSIEGISIEKFIEKILPKEISAPQKAYFTSAVREIRDIQKNYRALNKELPKEIKLTLSDASFQNDTILSVVPVGRKQTLRPWDDKFETEYVIIKDEDYNKPEIVNKLFTIKDKIAYIHIPAMVGKEEAPLLFEKINSFMKSIQNDSRALIIDVRSNGGGTRDITYEFAKYFIHPDSVFVVNATKQRGPIPLPKDYIESLHSRNLFAFSELDKQEKKSVTNFLKTFKPMYELDSKKYSEYYFGLLNGKKLAIESFYYEKPIYILVNEKSFSAASVFTAIFKNIPNVKIVGVTTDGSSGNSDRFELPNSQIRIKLSTMVSFQKDGKILDGIGTEPDIQIERDINQILWKSDTQLEKLRSLILSKK